MISCSVPGCDSSAKGMQEVALLECGHCVCRVHAPYDDMHLKVEMLRNIVTCGICHAAKEIKKARLRCGCSTCGYYGIRAVVTRDGDQVKFLIMECAAKHQLSFADVAWAYKSLASQQMQQCIVDVFKDGSIATINFSNNQIDTTAASLIAKELTRAGPKLAMLDLSRNKISYNSVWLIASTLAPNGCHLTSLNLGGNRIGPRGAKRIAAALCLKNCKLISLGLEDTHLGNEEAQALATALSNPNCSLTKLDISRNAIGIEGAKTVATELVNSGLSSLNLYLNRIQDEGAILIAAALGNCKLEELNVMHNKIGSKGVKAIADAIGGKICHLISLSVGKNQIDDEAARAIAASLASRCNRLVSLDLNSAKISDEGIKLIAAALENSSCNVTLLVLNNNKIGAEGAKSIFAAVGKEGCRLTSLRLGGNQIGFEGEKAIAAVLDTGRCKLQELEVTHISEEGEKFICAAFQKWNCKLYLHEDDIGDEAKEVVITASESLTISERFSDAKAEPIAIAVQSEKRENIPAAGEAMALPAAVNPTHEEQRRVLAPGSRSISSLALDAKDVEENKLVKDAKGNWIHTNILDGTDAIISYICRKNNIFLVKYSTGQAQVLKTSTCVSDEVDAIAAAMNEYYIPLILLEKTEYVAHPIKLCTMHAGDKTYVEILSEYGGRDLYAVLPIRFTPSAIIAWIKQSLSAMKAAEELGIFHSDIKPSNMVYDGKALKIIDYGSSTATSAKDLQRTNCISEIRGTRCYFPPEIFNHNRNDASKGAIDVYCWGMSFYQLLTHKYCDRLEYECKLYKHDPKSYREFLKIVDDISIPGEGGKELRNKFIPVLKKALAYHPYMRPTFAQLYEIVEMKEL